MPLDGLHEHRAKRLAVGLPSDRPAFLNSSHAGDPRLLVFTLQFADLVDQLLEALQHHFNLGLLQHAIRQFDEFVHPLVLLAQDGFLRVDVAFLVGVLLLVDSVDLDVVL